MKNDIRDFMEKFEQIRNLGYVKAVNNDFSGIGLTFESLLGKSVDNFPLPDFNNTLEIKTKLAYSTRPLHLFKLTPEGNNFYEMKKIVEKYGYYNSENRDNKVFNGCVRAGMLEKIGLFYYFSLEVNYKEERIKLLVYDINKRLIDNTTYWDFEKIENALKRKLEYLVLVDVWPTERNGEKYYKYYRYSIYKYSNVYTFLSLVEKGIISITFSVGLYNSADKLGRIHDHGTSFDIKKEDLRQLFYQVV